MTYWRFRKAYTKASVKYYAAYRIDLLLHSSATLIFNSFLPILVALIYKVSNGIPGWSFNQIIFFQGIFTIAMGLSFFLFSTMPWEVSYLVNRGELDRHMLYPSKLLVTLTGSAVDLDALVDIGFGFVLFIYGFIKLSLAISFFKILLFIFLLSCGLLFAYALTVMASALAIKYVKTDAFIFLLHELLWVAKHPISIYGGSGRLFLTTLFPLGIYAFYPAQALLGTVNMQYIAIAVVSTIVFFMVSLLIWIRVLKHYASAGG